MELPKRISPCPIVDALLEIRFSTKIDPNAVFGIIYKEIQDDFEKVEKLPILELPDAIRSSEKNFKFKPYYRLPKDNFVIQVGPDVLTISSFPEYSGWSLFSKKIYSVLERIEKVDIIDSIIRIGMRYINFFERNIYDNINLRISLRSKIINYKNTVIRTEINQEDFQSTLQISNNAEHKGEKGSIIDIDTFITDGIKDFFSKKEEIIENGHQKEKELFFSLLKKDFLAKLNPEY